MAEDEGGSGPQIRLGVSSCLLGEEVRFDGGHKKNSFLTKLLGQYVAWVPVCPEVEVGMGIPRENIRLVGDPDAPQLVAPKSGTDHTESMAQWSRKRVEELAVLNLHGYVLKKDSPSCGLFRVRVYAENGVPERTGRGAFAQVLAERFPLLPMEEEGRLNDLPLRENFIERMFAYYRWTRMLEKGVTPKGLVDFHTAHKMTLLSHSPKHYRELGRLVAQAGAEDLDVRTDEYGRLLMEGLSVLTTPGKHTNVIQHLMGFLKDGVTARDRAELLEVVESYRKQLVPLVVPLTLLQHHLKRNPVPEWVHQQVYLNPYPQEMMLRNHV
ncbi:MAG: DUF523 and DUF1722 domain-containing protein [bacterium]|nr:DUF523 and DUF1722 domain-containing protein [bacterium]